MRPTAPPSANGPIEELCSAGLARRSRPHSAPICRCVRHGSAILARDAHVDIGVCGGAGAAFRRPAGQRRQRALIHDMWRPGPGPWFRRRAAYRSTQRLPCRGVSARYRFDRKIGKLCRTARWSQHGTPHERFESLSGPKAPKIGAPLPLGPPRQRLSSPNDLRRRTFCGHVVEGVRAHISPIATLAQLGRRSALQAAKPERARCTYTLKHGVVVQNKF